FAAAPHTHSSGSAATVDHAVPSQCSVTPTPRAVMSLPTAHTSPGPLPHTPRRETVVPLVTADQAVPFQCAMAPPAPTAHTSSGPLPHTPANAVAAGGALAAHHPPGQAAELPPPP